MATHNGKNEQAFEEDRESKQPRSAGQTPTVSHPVARDSAEDPER